MPSPNKPNVNHCNNLFASLLSSLFSVKAIILWFVTSVVSYLGWYICHIHEFQTEACDDVQIPKFSGFDSSRLPDWGYLLGNMSALFVTYLIITILVNGWKYVKKTDLDKWYQTPLILTLTLASILIGLVIIVVYVMSSIFAFYGTLTCISLYAIGILLLIRYSNKWLWSIFIAIFAFSLSDKYFHGGIPGPMMWTICDRPFDLPRNWNYGYFLFRWSCYIHMTLASTFYLSLVSFCLQKIICMINHIIVCIFRSKTTQNECSYFGA